MHKDENKSSGDRQPCVIKFLTLCLAFVFSGSNTVANISLVLTLVYSFFYVLFCHL